MTMVSHLLKEAPLRIYTMLYAVNLFDAPGALTAIGTHT